MQNTNEYVTDLGHLHLRIEEILDERGISKNKLCKDMDIPRTNFNRYCQVLICILDDVSLVRLHDGVSDQTPDSKADYLQSLMHFM